MFFTNRISETIRQFRRGAYAMFVFDWPWPYSRMYSNLEHVLVFVRKILD